MTINWFLYGDDCHNDLTHFVLSIARTPWAGEGGYTQYRVLGKHDVARTCAP